jgi:hypothetical protein
LRNDSAWFRLDRRSNSGLRGNGSDSSGRSSFGWSNRNRLCRHARLARFFFLLLLLGQEGLHHIAGLGDMRKIDLGNYGFRALAAGCCAGVRCSVP